MSTLSNAIQIYTSNEVDSPLAHSNHVTGGETNKMNKKDKFFISGQITKSSLQSKNTSAKSIEKSDTHDLMFKSFQNYEKKQAVKTRLQNYQMLKIQ